MPIVSIPLNHGKTVVIDAADAELVAPYTWYAVKIKYNWYAHARQIRADGRSTTIYMHRIIMGSPNGLKVDHKDRDGLNNRRENLRICTNSQNMRNRGGPPSQNTSGYLGVWFEKRRQHWVAEVFDNGKKIYVGSYATAEAAGRARDDAARELYGEFITLNFPDELEVA